MTSRTIETVKKAQQPWTLVPSTLNESELHTAMTVCREQKDQSEKEGNVIETKVWKLRLHAYEREAARRIKRGGA